MFWIMTEFPVPGIITGIDRSSKKRRGALTNFTF